MAKPLMNCNFQNCDVVLTKFAWITRCSHVFCEEHGEMFFRKGGSQVRCPSCNELKSQENDIIRNDLNPSDLLIATVCPTKALELAFHAVRLWSYQMEYRKKCHSEQLSRKYESLAVESTAQLQTENKELKSYIQSLEKKLKHVNDELLKIRARFNKYKLAYHSSKAQSIANSSDMQDAGLNDNLHFHESLVFSTPRSEQFFLPNGF